MTVEEVPHILEKFLKKICKTKKTQDNRSVFLKQVYFHHFWTIIPNIQHWQQSLGTLSQTITCIKNKLGEQKWTCLKTLYLFMVFISSCKQNC